MQVDALEIPDLKLITPVKHSDERGFFSEIYSQRDMEAAGLNPSFLQENCSFSAPKYTVRGLHWQSPPTAQAKLIQVTQGAILDVAVDVRLNSPWFGRHVAVELSADNWQQLLVPVGFAHGFCTLEEDTTVLYKVDAYYSAADDHGLRWNDPTLGIDWPVSADAAILSGKDKNLPMLADCDLPFIYTETQS
jgi:dTDP-4-dehydrorhamnose 3,5-epimerase